MNRFIFMLLKILPLNFYPLNHSPKLTQSCGQILSEIKFLIGQQTANKGHFMLISGVTSN